MSTYIPKPTTRLRSELSTNPAILAVYIVTDLDPVPHRLHFRGEDVNTGPMAKWTVVIEQAAWLTRFSCDLFETEAVIRVGPWNVVALRLPGRTLFAVVRAEDPFMKSMRRWMRRYADRLDDLGLQP